MIFDLQEGEEAYEEIIEWLHDRNIRSCIYLTCAYYGSPGQLTILLPPENIIEAVYLALWDGCIFIEAIKTL